MEHPLRTLFYELFVEPILRFLHWPLNAICRQAPRQRRMYGVSGRGTADSGRTTDSREERLDTMLSYWEKVGVLGPIYRLLGRGVSDPEIAGQLKLTEVNSHGGGSMTAIPNLQTAATLRLDRALENAVVLGWNELMPMATAGVIHVEYHSGPDHSLEYVKIWASRERKQWNLICEYWTCSLWSHVPGLSFGKGYRSGDFSRRLENVMQHEAAFAKLPHQDGSIQVYPPTESERTAAGDWMTGAFAELGSGLAVPAMAV